MSGFVPLPYCAARALEEKRWALAQRPRRSKPESDGETIIGSVSVRSKMPDRRPATTVLYGVRENGKLKPFSRDVQQSQMFDYKKVTGIRPPSRPSESRAEDGLIE
jgi:hypothetical protein